MEKNLDRVMEEIMSNPEVMGCIFADEQGLCLGAKGQASPETSGFITAMADQAAKIEPKNKAPIVTLESDNRLCMIQKTGSVTGAIYKVITPQN